MSDKIIPSEGEETMSDSPGKAKIAYKRVESSRKAFVNNPPIFKNTPAPTSNAKQPSGPSTKAGRKLVMLTSAQLSDLFRRLDANGDGELDLDEFLSIIKKLKITSEDITDDFISSVFRQVDTRASGTLSMQEFICAYQTIYTKATAHKGFSFWTKEKEVARRGEYIKATRYGYDARGNYMLETYVISSKSESEKCVFNGFPNKDTKINQVEGRESGKSFAQYIETCTVSKWENASCDELNRMMVKDSQDNYKHKSCIFWWVDVALESVERSSATKFVNAFGFPNTSKFMSSFGNFGSLLPKERKSRMYAGNGLANSTGEVSSLSIFIQTAYLKNRPIIHHVPGWMEFSVCYDTLLGDLLTNYYATRFSWIFNFSGFSGTRIEEKRASYVSAESLAERLKDDDENDVDLEDVARALNPNYNPSNPGLRSLIDGIPLPPQEIFHRSSPTWVLPTSEMKQNPPVLDFTSLSLHILDHGFGACCLVTVRQIDDEGVPSRSLEEKTRTGCIGRLMAGVWRKLFEVIAGGGTAEKLGELDDSSAALSNFMILMVHSLSMNTMGSLEQWLDIIDDEVAAVCVTKHKDHLTEIQSLVETMKGYVDPLVELVEDLRTKWTDHNRDVVKNLRLIPKDRMNKLRSMSISQGAVGRPGGILGLVGNRTRSDSKELKEEGDESLDEYIGDPYNEIRKEVLQSRDLKSFKTLPDGIAKLDIHYDIIKHFFVQKSRCQNGENDDEENGPFEIINKLLEGNEELEVKGLKYWNDSLESCVKKVDNILAHIKAQSEEKRNFTTFSLTIFTVFLAPLTILTGYWGMNFDNMVELTSTTYPSAPGVYLLWVTAGLVYATLVVFSMHFRILYSAT